MHAIRRATFLTSKAAKPMRFARSFSAVTPADGADEADKYVDSIVKGEFDKNLNKISEIMSGDDHSKKALILKALGKLLQHPGHILSFAIDIVACIV